MIPDIDLNLVTSAIKSEIEKRAAEIIEQETEATTKRVHDRIRSEIGEISTRVFQHMSFERYGVTIRIEVDTAKL